MEAARISENELSELESRGWLVVDDTIPANSNRAVIRAAAADTLTQETAVNVLVIMIKDYQGYKQTLSACMDSVAKRFAAELAAYESSATIGVLRSELIVKDPAPHDSRRAL